MSDSPTVPSGFGNVTRFVCAGLAQSGHRVSILGWQARGSPAAWQGCTVYPVRHDSFGADVLLSYLQRLQPDVLVTLADVWWLTYIANPVIANFMRIARIPWVLYYPIDGDTGGSKLPPSWVRVLKTVNLPVAMSEYGRAVTSSNGVPCACIPHGVETQIFCPPSDKDAAKQAVGYLGKFVVLSDARNQPRKLLPRTLEIFRRFAAGKDDVVLHLHRDPDDPAAKVPEYSYDIRADVALLGLSEKVRFTVGMSVARGLPLNQLSAIYQAADVHLLSSWGEGFGLPTLQAAAAGIIPMASDYSASRELVVGHGEAIAIAHWMEDQFGVHRALIDIDDAVRRLEELYGDADRLLIQSKAARRFAEEFSWDRIIPQWHELLEREVPRLRAAMDCRTPTSLVQLEGDNAQGPPELTRVIQTALPDIVGGARVTLSVVDNKSGQLTADVYRDALSSGRCLTIPVTLPSPDRDLVKSRVPGCVYPAGENDIPVAKRLSEVFPALNAWSTSALDLGVGRFKAQPVRAKAVDARTSEFRKHFAASTLAIDLGGVDAKLAERAAEFGVPCIGLNTEAGQCWLWPELSLDEADPAMATLLGRWMLTDQGEAAAACARAQEKLVGKVALMKVGT